MSAGSGFGSLLALLIFAFIWISLGVVLVATETYANGMDLPQDAYNVMGILNVGYLASSVIFAILVVINHWLVSKSQSNMGV